MSFETVRQLALQLPGIIDFSDRDLLMQADPDTFFVTEHYVGHPLMLVRLSSVRREQLRMLLEDAWRGAAPKRLVSEYDAES